MTKVAEVADFFLFACTEATREKEKFARGITYYRALTSLAYFLSYTKFADKEHREVPPTSANFLTSLRST